MCKTALGHFTDKHILMNTSKRLDSRENATKLLLIYMKKKISPTQKFEDLIIKIADKNIDNLSYAEIIKTANDVIQCKEKMFWLICIAMGLKEGSTYAQGACKLKKHL